MKTLKIIITAIFLSFVSIVYASNNEITLVTSGEGITKEEATKNALRNAIEQAFGTFVSSNTVVLNDELVRDEIITISRGNIKSYRELGCVEIQNRKTVNVEATVSIDNLTSYAKSKGMSTELAGATFAMQVKIYELNKKNEEIAVNHLKQQLESLLANSFSKSMTVEDPVFDQDKGKYVIKAIVSSTKNKNFAEAMELVANTLDVIALKPEEIAFAKKTNIATYKSTGPRIQPKEIHQPIINKNANTAFHGPSGHATERDARGNRIIYTTTRGQSNQRRYGYGYGRSLNTSSYTNSNSNQIRHGNNLNTSDLSDDQKYDPYHKELQKDRVFRDYHTSHFLENILHMDIEKYAMDCTIKDNKNRKFKFNRLSNIEEHRVADNFLYYENTYVQFEYINYYTLEEISSINKIDLE